MARLQGLAGASTETVTIPASVAYLGFQNTLDNKQQPVTAIRQLQDFLAGTGYTVADIANPNPDPSRTDPYRDITSITDTAGPTGGSGRTACRAT